VTTATVRSRKEGDPVNPMKKHGILIVSIAFFMMTALTFLIESRGFILTIERWTPIPMKLWLFALGGLFLAIHLFMIAKRKLLRIGVVVLALLGLYVVAVYAMMSYEPVRVVREEGFTLYVVEHRFLFDGDDRYYAQENPLFARYLGTGCQSEDCSSIHSIEDGMLVIREFYYGGPEAGEETRVPLA